MIGKIRWLLDRSSEVGCGQVTVPAEPGAVTFQVDSLLLADLHRELFAEPGVESFVYLTGQEVGPGRFTLNRCVPIEHEAQSATGAAGDPLSAIETLTELDEAGHRLLGHAHNHPGTGVAGVEPSGTDLAYQRELEEGGYTAVGLVLSEDGYVRFFTDGLAVEVAVYGAHINRLESHEFTFHIEETARTAFE